MAAAIKAVSDSGVPCYFIHGNRDFLLGKRFARESGMTLLPEEKVLELYGRRVLIMHGDTLCTDDAGYQAFRAKVHKPWLQTLFLALPLFVRKRIAARMRANSKEANSSKSLAIMDVNQNAVVSAMEKHQVQWLILGIPIARQYMNLSPISNLLSASCWVPGIRKVQWSKSRRMTLS